MRSPIPYPLALFVLSAALWGAASADEPAAVATFEPGIARPGGVYATLSIPDSQACAQACAQDPLCMSWTLMSLPEGGQCELKAVIPHAVEDARAVSGLSARVPAFARLTGYRIEIGPPRDLTAPPPSAPRVAPPPVPRSAPEEPAVTEEAVAAADSPGLPPPRFDANAPILLSADSAPLPLRTREATATP